MMPVAYRKWITRDMLRSEPASRFVFGDNTERVGLGGQAREMRGEPNAIGVATLFSPGVYYRPNDPDALEAVMKDLNKVTLELSLGRVVYVPSGGIGTGLAHLPENAPELHRLIVAFFRAAPGETCPWKD